jgi:hypothetical protein
MARDFLDHFHKFVMGVPPNGLFISWKIPLKWRIWGLFQETSIYPTFDELWAFRSWPVDYILEYVFIHIYIIIYIYIYWSYPHVSPFTAHRTRWNGAGGGSKASKKRRPLAGHPGVPIIDRSVFGKKGDKSKKNERSLGKLGDNLWFNLCFPLFNYLNIPHS